MPASGHVMVFDVETKQPDGSWTHYYYLPSDYGGPKWWDPVSNTYTTRVKAQVGSGNIKFPADCISIVNYGDAYGDIFGDLYQNGARILYTSVPSVRPNWGFSMPAYDKLVDMPGSIVKFTLKAGHNTTVDESVELTVEPVGVVPTPAPPLKSLISSFAVLGAVVVAAVVERRMR